MAAKAVPKDATEAAPPSVRPALRTDGADTASERATMAANTPEAHRVAELTAEVDRLNKMTSALNGLVDQKNGQIAELELQNTKLRAEVGRLAVLHVQAGAMPKGLTSLEFKDARKAGQSSFVVLAAWTSRTKSAQFHMGQGIDARQHPKLADYIEQGLLITPLPEGGG